ncbi:Copia protein, partial [Mucuna pruriens]
MEDSESIVNYFDRIQELVNAMRACKEKVTNQTLPPEFDYVAAAIEESKDLDTMEVEELQHSLKNKHFKHKPTTKEKAKVLGKGINTAPIRNTKIKNLVKLVSPLKKGGQTKHKSKVATPKIARSEREGAKNKPNNHAHLTKDERTDSDSEVVVLLAITSEVEHIEFEKAMIEEKWLKAMKEEINSIKKNQTWELVDSPSNKKLIALKWVYKVKVNPRDEVVKNKARLVTIGEVYALVARIETIKLVVAITINVGWSMHQLDVKFAFLNGPLEEEVYVNQPLDFVVKGKENKMMHEFEMSDLGLLSYFLGIEFEMTQYKMVMHQTMYAKDLLKRLNMQQSNPIGTPVEVGLSLKKEKDEEQGTIDFGILFPKEKATAKPELVGYSDLDWCANKQDRKNTIGCIFFYGRAPIYWSSTKESVVTLSSCEVEYIAVSKTTCQAVWVDALLGELQEKNSKKVKLLVDKKYAIDLARHPISHGRSKHIETRFHFLKKQVNNEKLQIKHYRAKIQFANIFIKALKRE